MTKPVPNPLLLVRMSRFITAAFKTGLPLIFLLSVVALKAYPKLVISEFMCINEGVIQDEDNENSDWIEVYNAGEEAVIWRTGL